MLLNKGSRSFYDSVVLEQRWNINMHYYEAYAVILKTGDNVLNPKFQLEISQPMSVTIWSITYEIV